MRPLEFLYFLRDYLPVFMAGVFSGLFSGALTSSLVFEAVYKDNVAREAGVKWVFVAWIVMAFIVTLCNFLILRGRPTWVWGMVAFLLACLFATLPVLEYRPHKITFMLGVLFPLLGLLALNSKRHRELRQILLVVRYKRERVLGIRKARNRRLSKIRYGS